MKIRQWFCENRRQVIAGTLMVVCIVVVLGLPYNIVSRLGVITILLCVFIFAAYNLNKRWWMLLVALPVIVLLLLYSFGIDMIVSQIVYDSPFQLSTESDVQVVPGGEVLSLSVAIEKESGQVVQQRNVTVCFYMPEDGPCVVGAHSLDLKPGDTYGISPVSETRVSENCHTARVLADSQYGVALLGPKCPDPNREELLLAGADEVKIGEEAVIRTFAKGDIPVNVLGFAMVGDDHFLVVRCIDGKAGVGPGMSGSPIIQDDRIVGFLHSVSRYLKGPKLVMTRPAVEVYGGLKEYLGH